MAHSSWIKGLILKKKQEIKSKTNSTLVSVVIKP